MSASVDPLLPPTHDDKRNRKYLIRRAALGDNPTQGGDKMQLLRMDWSSTGLIFHLYK